MKISGVDVNELKKEYIFFLGSRFEDDINTWEYSAKNIHKIQVCMEKGTITVFKNLESIYPSLYDLFNHMIICLLHSNNMVIWLLVSLNYYIHRL